MPLADILDKIEESFKSLAKPKEVASEENAALQSKQNEADMASSLNKIQDFVDRYRDTLGVQKDLTLQNLEQNRRNSFQNIMGNANTLGMMYSNFPERSKIQYDASTYMPARTKVQNTYQTGLDSLRANVTDYLNKLADYNDEIASLNKQYSNKNGSNGTVLNDAGDTTKYNAIEDRTWFYNANGDPVRFGTTVSRTGTPTTEKIISAANAVLDENALSWLSDIYKKARSNGYANIVVNAGESFSPNSLNFLDEAERNFMDSLGLTFAQ